MITHKNNSKKNYKKVQIYRLTNPEGAVYIGITNNAEARYKRYKSDHVDPVRQKRQPTLYASFLKHGVVNHKLEIIFEKEYTNLSVEEASNIEQDFILRHWINYRDKLLNDNIKGLMRGWRRFYCF
jgi:hypothetical protein